MSEPKDQATGTPSACHCSTVSLIDFQMTVANLSVAEYALREEPYERLPYLAGTMQVTQSQMETLRQEAMRLRSALLEIRDSKFNAYENTGSGQYGIGVCDGHRYCANIARDALGDNP